MSTETITLRNTISKVPWTYEASYAKRLLADPHYRTILEVVDSEKIEVLGQPRIDGAIVDNEGNPVKISNKLAEEVVLSEATTDETPSAKPAAKRTSAATKKD